jgi:hypothetical protein
LSGARLAPPNNRLQWLVNRRVTPFNQDVDKLAVCDLGDKRCYSSPNGVRVGR